jgi:DUF1680 family protein
VVCLVPGYRGLPANEVADAASSEAALLGNLTSGQSLGSFFLYSVCCKMNGPIHRTASYEWPSHPFRCCRPPVLLESKTLCSYAFILVTLNLHIDIYCMVVT